MDSIRDRIRALMAGKPEKEVGDASGVGQTWLNRVMNPDRADGIRSPGIAKLEMLAAYFGVPVGQIVNGVEPSAPSGAAVQSHSQSLKLDPVILAESIAALRQVAKRRGWDYDPETHAESTCYAYELWHELPAAPSTADVIDIGERIAERLRMEMEGRNGSGESGSGAGAGADDRGRDGTAGARKTRAAGGSR